MSHQGQLRNVPLGRLVERLREVEKQHREIRAESGVNVIRVPRDRRLFLISSMSPHKLRQRYQWWSYFHLAVLVLAVVAFFWLKLNKL